MLIYDVLTAVLVENETHTRSEAKAKRLISIITPEKFHNAARTDISPEVNILNCQPDSIAVIALHTLTRAFQNWFVVTQQCGYKRLRRYIFSQRLIFTLA